MTVRQKLNCLRCGYEWYSINKDTKNKVPSICARCRSPYYNKPKRMHFDRPAKQVEAPLVILTNDMEKETKEINEVI